MEPVPVPVRGSASAAFLARHGIGDLRDLIGTRRSTESLAAPLARVVPSSRRGVAFDWETDPDHHLWRNGRRWWVAFSVVEDGWRQERVRLSLGTDCRDEARALRDALFARLESGGGGCALSLRAGRRARRCA